MPLGYMFSNAQLGSFVALRSTHTFLLMLVRPSVQVPAAMYEARPPSEHQPAPARAELLGLRGDPHSPCHA